MKKNILVTSVGGRSVGSGILHALVRSSQEVRQRWHVIASDADTFAWGLYVAENSTLLPLASDSDYLAALLKVIDKFRIDVIIPGSEPEIFKLSSIKSQLPVPILTNRDELMPLMKDKFTMLNKLKELGLKYIETFPVTLWEDVIKTHDFPFILKPTVGTGGSRGLHFVISKNDIKSLLPSLSDQSNYCIQPYIGTAEEEYTVGVLSDKTGLLIDSIVMKRKLIGLSLLHSKRILDREYSVSTGYSQGFFIKHPQIQSYCENLAKSLSSTGPLNIQLRIKDNEIYVFEIHPRFSGTSPIRADVGFNEPDILLRNLFFNETFGRQDYRFNVAAIRAFEHVIVPIKKMK